MGGESETEREKEGSDEERGRKVQTLLCFRYCAAKKGENERGVVHELARVASRGWE